MKRIISIILVLTILTGCSMRLTDILKKSDSDSEESKSSGSRGQYSSDESEEVDELDIEETPVGDEADELPGEKLEISDGVVGAADELDTYAPDIKRTWNSEDIEIFNSLIGLNFMKEEESSLQWTYPTANQSISAESEIGSYRITMFESREEAQKKYEPWQYKSSERLVGKWDRAQIGFARGEEGKWGSVLGRILYDNLLINFSMREEMTAAEVKRRLDIFIDYVSAVQPKSVPAEYPEIRDWSGEAFPYMNVNEDIAHEIGSQAYEFPDIVLGTMTAHMKLYPETAVMMCSENNGKYTMVMEVRAKTGEELLFQWGETETYPMDSETTEGIEIIDGAGDRGSSYQTALIKSTGEYVLEGHQSRAYGRMSLKQEDSMPYRTPFQAILTDIELMMIRRETLGY